jgi:hypothetical protein
MTPRQEVEACARIIATQVNVALEDIWAKGYSKEAAVHGNLDSAVTAMIMVGGHSLGQIRGLVDEIYRSVTEDGSTGTMDAAGTYERVT